MIIPPDIAEVPDFYQTYTQKLTGDNLEQCLLDTLSQTNAVFEKLTAEQWKFAYAPEKWTLAEVLVHIIDTERVMAYRALRFARKDATSLPGFDQDVFAESVSGFNWDFKLLLEDYQAVRKATITLYKQMNNEMLDFKGMANNLPMTARVLGFVIAGHNLHHLKIVQQRYL